MFPRIGLLLLLAMALPTHAAPLAAPDPLTCTGYAEPRVFLDSQAWWVTTPGKSGPDNGHLHTSLCFPLHQVVKGTIPLDIRLTMHENPGQLRSIAVQVFTDKGATVVAQRSFKPALTCKETCSWWVHLDADTTRVPYDGRQEWRIRPKITEPDGKVQVGSTSYQTYLNNGKPKNDYRSYDLVQGKGWYEGASYAIARLDSGFPFAPVSGRWTIAFRCESDGPPVRGCYVLVDPDFHHGDFGTVLFRQPGAYKGTLTIDTAQIAPGSHKLVIRTDAPHESGSTNGGVLGIPFVVP
jgi:hypothetical protein